MTWYLFSAVIAGSTKLIKIKITIKAFEFIFKTSCYAFEQDECHGFLDDVDFVYADTLSGFGLSFWQDIYRKAGRRPALQGVIMLLWGQAYLPLL
jgi:hypothetical protein